MFEPLRSRVLTDITSFFGIMTVGFIIMDIIDEIIFPLEKREEKEPTRVKNIRTQDIVPITYCYQHQTTTTP